MLGCVVLVVLVVGLPTALSLLWAQEQHAARLAAEAAWRWQVGCLLAVGLGVAAYLWRGTAHRHEEAEQQQRMRNAAWERHYAREQALRWAAEEASRRAEEAARRAAAEAWERDRPAREARAQAQQAATREAYERDRPAREARARAQQASAREALAQAQRAAEELGKWRKLQTPIGSVCPSSSPADRNDASRRKQGFFKCLECHAKWRSNDCWRGAKQVCPDCRGCAAPPYRMAALDRNDDGRAQRGRPYTGALRSFGRFECACGRHWQSAHAWAGETQACLSCRRRVGPFWLEALARSAERSNEYASDRHHDTEGCSKCQKIKPQVCYRLPAATAPDTGGGAVLGQPRHRT